MNSKLINKLVLNELINEVYDDSKVESIELVQQLWSNYGSILRVNIENSPVKSVIVKAIKTEKPTNHPRGWNTNNSHIRKLKSYQIERNWYLNYSNNCTDSFRVPKCYLVKEVDEMQLILLEDLNSSGFSKRTSRLDFTESKVIIKWLARFHAKFLNTSPKDLWEQGSYWHLDTRKDEFELMADSALKSKADKIDYALKMTEHQTIIHGDAKLANFCFSEDLKSAAAVDFQYVGKGCGMIDLAYFIGSCFDENECFKNQEKALEYYFEEFKKGSLKNHERSLIDKVENEWRELYPYAVADFSRFLLGWMPNHSKLNSYSKKITDDLLLKIDS